MLSEGYCINSRVGNSVNQHLPVFSGICWYLPVNTAGMENTHICQHFANLAFHVNQLLDRHMKCQDIFSLKKEYRFFFFFFFKMSTAVVIGALRVKRRILDYF